MARLFKGHGHIGSLIGILILIVFPSLAFNCGGDAKSADDDAADNASIEIKTIFPSEAITLTTSDDVAIHGTFTCINNGELNPAVILCHQFRSNRASYKKAQALLAENGICSLAIDFRGFGESTENRLSFTNFSDRDYTNMLNDIEAAYGYLTEGDGKDHFNIGRIGLVGASIGANLAIMSGSKIDGLTCIVALSPGRDYHGLKPIDYAPDVEIPLLIAYAEGDRQSTEVIGDLTAALGDNKPTIIKLDGNSHGTDMLQEEFETDLLNWIKEQLKSEHD